MEKEQKEEKPPQTRAIKQLPFGTHSEKYSYSQFSHLSNNDKRFALDLATTEPLDLAPIIKEVKEAAAKSKVVLKAGELKELLGQTEEGIEPCTRKECVAIVRKILETQGRNKAERNDILATEDMYNHEIVSAEQDSTMLEEELAVANNESKRLEMTLSHLKEQLSKLTKTCRDLQHERDEFSNKVMVIETDRQRWVRKLQLADAALQDCIWRGVTSVNAQQLATDESEQSLAKSLVICQADERSVREAEAVTGTDYKRLVKSDMLDVTEYLPGSMSSSSSNASRAGSSRKKGPGSVASLPVFVQQQLAATAKSVATRESQRLGGDSVGSFGNRTMPNYVSSSLSLDGGSVVSALTNGTSPARSSTGSVLGYLRNHSAAGTGEQTRFFGSRQAAAESMRREHSAAASRGGQLPGLRSGGGGNGRHSASSMRNGAFGKHTNPMDGTIILDLKNADAYRGYTPTGSPQFRRSELERTFRSRGGMHSGGDGIGGGGGSRGGMSSGGGKGGDAGGEGGDVPDGFGDMPGEDEGVGDSLDGGGGGGKSANDSFSSVSFASSSQSLGPRLAPVFYNETARSQWGREAPIGKLRVRNPQSDKTMGGSRRKLLTSKGHPQVFLNQGGGGTAGSSTMGGSLNDFF